MPLAIRRSAKFNPQARIFRRTSPAAGSLVSGNVPVVGTAASAKMQNYEVLVGLGVSPTSWTTVTTSSDLKVGQTLGVWDSTSVPDGPYTIRVVVWDQEFGAVSSEVLVVVRNENAN